MNNQPPEGLDLTKYLDGTHFIEDYEGNVELISGYNMGDVTTCDADGCTIEYTKDGFLYVDKRDSICNVRRVLDANKNQVYPPINRAIMEITSDYEYPDITEFVLNRIYIGKDGGYWHSFRADSGGEMVKSLNCGEFAHEWGIASINHNLRLIPKGHTITIKT